MLTINRHSQINMLLLSQTRTSSLQQSPVRKSASKPLLVDFRTERTLIRSFYSAWQKGKDTQRVKVGILL